VKDPRTEGVLSNLRVKFEYLAEFPVTRLVSDPDTQVRLGDNLAHPKEVKKYKDLLGAGVEFPPIVILKDGRIIDGNTRFGAYDQMRRTVISAYVCDISSKAVARRIAVELNAVHGKRMDKEELAHWLAEGNGSVSEEDALRITGWNGRTIRRVRNSLQFEARRTKLSVTLTTSLPEGVRAALNRVTNPELFRALTTLADDAGLTEGEVNKVAKNINEVALTDVAAAHQIINDLRDDCRQRIEERAAGLRLTTPMFQQLSMHAGWLIKQGASRLHDINPHTASRSKALLESTLDVVRDSLERY
jgi:hypothetical protein